MCEVWGRVCARSDSDRHSTRLRSKDATASQHTRTPTPCCCGTSRNPPVQALLCLDAPSDVEAAPFPSEHRKVHALGLPRERAHHCDNTLSSSCNQRWFNAFNTFCFNTFAADLPVVSVLRLVERARTPGHPACCSLAQVGQPIRWGRTWAPACTRTSGHPTLHSPGRTWAPPLMQEFRRRVRQIVGGGVHSEVLQPFPSGLRKRMGEWTRRSGCGDWTVTATFTFAHIDEVLARDRLAIRVACQLRCPGRDEAHEFRGGLLHQKLGFRVDLRARTFGQFLPHYPVDAGQRQQKVLRDTDTGI